MPRPPFFIENAGQRFRHHQVGLVARGRRNPANSLLRYWMPESPKLLGVIRDDFIREPQLEIGDYKVRSSLLCDQEIVSPSPGCSFVVFTSKSRRPRTLQCSSRPAQPSSVEPSKEAAETGVPPRRPPRRRQGRRQVKHEQTSGRRDRII